MMRALLSASALVFAAAGTASAQAGIYSHAKAAATHAVAATNAHTEAEQHPEAPASAAKSSAKSGAAQQAANATSASGKASAQGAKAQPAQSAQSAQPGSQLSIASADTVPPAVIMRESFDYSRDGRRDPFMSLLMTSELRPAISDLRLTGILFDDSGSHSVATLRDVGTNELYRVVTGTPLGRMRVSAIRLKTIVFTIDEFGTTRQDSLVLGDSTKERGK